MPLAGELNEVLTVHVGRVGDLTPARVSFAGGSAVGSIPPWHIDEFLGLTEFNQNYGYMDNGSSKAYSGKLGDSDSPILRAVGEELDDDECLGQVPESSRTVPQIPSPPTASGLYWPKNSQNLSDSVVYVPDTGSSPLQNFQNGTIVNRQRRF